MNDPTTDPDLVEHLDDETLRLTLDTASAEDQPILLAEVERRGLDV